MFRTITAALVGAALVSTAWGDDGWYGIVKKEPEGDYVQWLIGDSELTMGENTRIKVAVGRLEIGACAEVDVDGELIERVKTRPMSKCDDTDYEAYFESFRALGAQDG